MQEQVRFHFIPDGFSQNQPANAGGAKGEDRFIEPPTGHHPAREHVRIEKETKTPAVFAQRRDHRRAHERLDLARDLGFAAGVSEKSSG